MGGWSVLPGGSERYIGFRGEGIVSHCVGKKENATLKKKKTDKKGGKQFPS